MAFVVGCANPDGSIVVTNKYTGACAITVKVAEGDAGHQTAAPQPIADGDQQTLAGAGNIDLVFMATGSICPGALQFACGFEGSMGNTAACGVYAAGEAFSATVDIVDVRQGQCPNGNIIPIPGLLCDGVPSNP